MIDPRVRDILSRTEDYQKFASALSSPNYPEGILELFLEALNWKYSLLNQCGVNWVVVADDSEPEDAIAALLDYEVQCACDPLVSQAAENLYQKGRTDAFTEVEQAKILNKNSIPRDFTDILPGS